MKKLNRNKYRIFCLAVISALAVYFSLPPRLGQSQESESPGATFTVTRNADSGVGSLRQAITDANASAGADTIQFQIGTGTVQINVDSALPVITGAVTIDGTTQPGFSGRPLIILRRNNAPNATNGLQISGGGSTVKGLAVIRFSNGVMFETAGGNTVTGCFIGVDPRDEGTNLSSILSNGILITNSPNNHIGGNTAATRNVIGRCSDGIEINGAASTGNVVTGNDIGMRSNGLDTASNGTNGVFIDGAPNNRIGGTTPGERNLISGNTDLTMQVDLRAGIQINGTAATGNTIQGNFIGTDVTGTLARSNSFGVWITNAVNNTVGGTIGTTPGIGCTGACNLISGNRREGVQLGSNVNVAGAGGT